jgi:hypothetical protein
MTSGLKRDAMRLPRIALVFGRLRNRADEDRSDPTLKGPDGTVTCRSFYEAQEESLRAALEYVVDKPGSHYEPAH